MQPNTQQRRILIIGLLLLVTMCLVPPWLEKVHVRGATVSKPNSYHPIFNPPHSPQYNIEYAINGAKLFTQLATVVALMGLGLVLTAPKPPAK